MIIDSLAGRFDVTASKVDVVRLSASKKQTLISVLDGVELVGGAEGEDPTFSSDDIKTSTVFRHRRYHVLITRAQLVRYFEYEILNYLTYASLSEMHSLARTPHTLDAPHAPHAPTQGDKQ